jgi:hypothetical protein
VEFATYRRFLDAPLVSADAPIECLVRATVSDHTRTGSVLRLAFFFVTGEWLLVVRPQLNASSAGVITRVTLFVIRYVVFWAKLWATRLVDRP